MPDQRMENPIRRTALIRAAALLGAIYAVILITLSARGISASTDELLSAVDTWQNGEWLAGDETKEQNAFWHTVSDAGNQIEQLLRNAKCKPAPNAEAQAKAAEPLPNTRDLTLLDPSPHPYLTLGDNFSGKTSLAPANKWDGVREGHNRAYPVNYQFAIYINPYDPDNKTKVTPGERAHLERDVCRYEQVAFELHERWKKKFGSESNFRDNNPHCRRMADILGINCTKAFPDLDLGVSWVYIASTTGTYAIFPGNQEIRNQDYDPLQRPWYLSAIDGDPWNPGKNKAKSERVHVNPRAGVTVPYRDYSDKLGDVRTYWQKVEIGGDKYVIGIDFLLFGDREQDKAALLKHIKAAIWERAVKVFVNRTVWSFIATSLIALLFAGVFRFNWQAMASTLVIGATSVEHEIVLTEETRDFTGNALLEWREVEGKVERRSILSTVSAFVTGVFRLIGLALGLVKKVENEQSSAQTIEKKYTVTAKPGLLRGIEVWFAQEVRYVAGVSRSTGAPIRVPEGRSEKNWFIVGHTANEPSVRPHDIRTGAVKSAVAQICKELGEYVLLSGKSRRGSFVLGQPLPIGSVPQKVAELHEVETLSEQHLELTRSRFYFQDSVAIIKQLYRDSRVCATCRSEYLEMLLKENSLDVLETGEEISRIVIFRDEEQKEAIFKANPLTLSAWIERMAGTVKFIYLDKVDVELPRSNDFAIVTESPENKLVAVTAADTHRWDGKVKGYISWRDADIEHYTRIYQQLDAVGELYSM